MQGSRQFGATARVEIAALNNALWCDAVCRAHGVPGVVQPTVWLNPNVPPPYHSNLVVISSLVSQAEVDAHVRHLSRCLPSPTWSIKDSFMNLDMECDGFGVLFQATWIWRDAGLSAQADLHMLAQGSRIETPAELALWETAWRGDAGNQAATGRPRQFPDVLLSDPGTAFLALGDAGGLIAGGIANRTPGAVGLSNVFVVDGDPSAAWTGLARLAAHIFPGFPIVGYERDEDLALATSVGFEPIGELRVWMKNPPGDAVPA